jgi:hypothetical protein
MGNKEVCVTYINACRCNFPRHVSLLRHLFYRRLIGMQEACLWEGNTNSEYLNLPTSTEYRKQAENKIYGNLMMMQFQGRLYSVYQSSILFLCDSSDDQSFSFSSLFNLIESTVFWYTYATSNFFIVLMLYSHFLCFADRACWYPL